MTIDLLHTQEQKKLHAKKICTMAKRGSKKVLQIDLSSFTVEDSEKIASIIRESCQIVTLMGYGVSIEKQFVQDQKQLPPESR